MNSERIVSRKAYRRLAEYTHIASHTGASYDVFRAAYDSADKATNEYDAYTVGLEDAQNTEYQYSEDTDE